LVPAKAVEHIEVSGITEPVVDVTLSSDVAGKVAKIFFKEGDFVKQGDTILELEKTLEELEVERRLLILESKVELNTAVEQEKTLKSMLESTRSLFEKTKSVSKDEMEKLELDYKLAVGKRMQFEVAEEKELIEYNIALENLRRRTLVAPVDCIITDLALDIGETCEPRQPLVTVVDTSKCLFVANIEERLGRTLKKGMAASLKIRTGDTTVERQGKVVYVSPVVDSASSLLEIKVEFDNSDRSVRPGVSGTMLVTLP
jgi:RND family efflux transporter MFP subunit